EHVSDVESYLMTSKAQRPIDNSLLPEDVRWEAIPSEGFEAALRRYRWVKHKMILALLGQPEAADAETKYRTLTEPLSLLKTAVLDLHGAAGVYIRNGPEQPSEVTAAPSDAAPSAPPTKR